MSTTTKPGLDQAAQAARQGYLVGDRPRCGNCWKSSDTEDQCTYTGIDVEPAGWCPQWFPKEVWLRRNPTVGARMGLCLGAGVDALAGGAL